MGRAVSFKVNKAEFDATLRRYRQLSSRDPEKICNTKAFFIARRAVIETPKADKGVIKTTLGKVVVRNKKIVSMKLASVKRFGRFGQQYAAPIAALMINARRGAKDKPGLYGQAMTDAIRKMIGARMSSIAFIKSGWLSAIRALQPLADTRGAPRSESGPKQIGVSKGYAIAAVEGWRAKATIVNTASTNRDHKQALIKFGEPALQRAFDAETASMREYMERKLKETADKAGIKHN